MPFRRFKRARYVERLRFRSSGTPPFARAAMRVIERKKRAAYSRMKREVGRGFPSCQYVG